MYVCCDVCKHVDARTRPCTHISAYPFRGLRGVWQFLPPLVPSYPPPWDVILGVGTSTYAAPRHPRNCSRNDIVSNLVFERILNPISNDFWYQTRSPIHPKFISLSSVVSKLSFASKTKVRSIFAKTKILQNVRTVVQKSTLRILGLIVKYHLHLVRIWYPNPTLVNQISLQKPHLKQTSFFRCCFSVNVFQNELKKEPKMLDRNWGKWPWGHFGHLKRGSSSQRHLQSPSRSSFWSHMAVNWTPFAHSTTCSVLIGRVILVGKPQCTAPMTGFLVRNLLIRPHPCTHLHCSSFNT